MPILEPYKLCLRQNPRFCGVIYTYGAQSIGLLFTAVNDSRKKLYNIYHSVAILREVVAMIFPFMHIRTNYTILKMFKCFKKIFFLCFIVNFTFYSCSLLFILYILFMFLPFFILNSSSLFYEHISNVANFAVSSASPL